MTLEEALVLIAKQQEIIAQQQATIEQQAATIVRLEARIAELEARLNRSSKNSDKPPSSDPPWKQSGDSAPKKKRPRRKGMWRALVDESKVDRIEQVRPTNCPRCFGKLSGEPCRPPVRQQCVEIPEVRAHITEYRLEALACRRCYTVTRAQMPGHAPKSPFGPRLMAQVSVLSSAYRLSKRQIQGLLKAQWDIAISLGGISQIEARMSEAIRVPYEAVREHVTQARVVFADETPWKQRNRLAWLWTAGTKEAVAFQIHRRRTSEVAKGLLSENFRGILVSDRYSGYAFVPWEKRQVCWAHLLREFTAMSEQAEGVPRYVGEQVLARLKEMFSLWRAYRAHEIGAQAFFAAIEPVCEQIEAAIKLGAQASHAETQSKCRSILKSREAFFRFVRYQGVEPTNNRAERALRHGVIYRKVSLGTQSERGSRFVERMLSVVQTLSLQARSAYVFLYEAAVALRSGREAPVLLPA